MAGSVIRAISYSRLEKAQFIETAESKRLLEDPFENSTGYGDMIHTPPYSLEQLVYLAECHPVHAAALEQKVSDIIAGGPKFTPLHENDVSVEHDKVILWWKSLFKESTGIETLHSMWLDYETVGWGFLEIVRDLSGNVTSLYHVPGHTMRAGSNGLYVQMRSNKRTWFKRYGDTNEYNVASGEKLKDAEDLVEVPFEKRSNEVICFKKSARRSSYYGIPSYVAAIGQITLAVAARDYNILFFENHREPRYIIVLEGLTLGDDSDKLLDDIEQTLKSNHKEPHRNLILPIAGDAKVRVERMGANGADINFEKLQGQTQQEILTAHRMPLDRIGSTNTGALSGSASVSLNRIYKEGVVSRGQAILEDILTDFIDTEYEKTTGRNADTLIDFEELDINDQSTDSTIVQVLVASEIITLNEARKKIRMEPKPEFEDMTFLQWSAKVAPKEPPGAPVNPAPDKPITDRRTVEVAKQAQTAMENKVAEMESDIVRINNLISAE